MSSQVNKIDADGRDGAVSQARGRASAPQRPAEQAKVAETAPAAEEVSTSYGAMLQEAYDGDTAETMAVVANARRTGDTQGGEAPDVAARMPHEKTAAARVTPVEPDAKSEQVLEGLRNRKKAGPVTAGQAAAPSRDKAPSAKRMHDQLMLASSKMGVSEVATHVSLRSFIQLTRILSKGGWLRQTACTDKLMKTQMNTMREARTG
ncbi:hypothetical protein HW532_17465 [Kaustia mangrovi]|uniref:Uncharacterized protein n=1 Tax=Kaustia mangrovi TaxID=2593653 RepID=A0A7S8C6Z8_9HYPH|nr:hypothetical protein [Kaustia mangrovi]QPC44329.1 hypothetical protein HW532_17465 [Kaustia mangrovi]